MPIRFQDPITGSEVRSTELARRVLGASAKDHPKLQENIFGAPDWRKWYLRLYADLAIEEGKSVASTKSIATIGLNAFHDHLATETGEKLVSVTKKAWGQDLVQTLVIEGHGPVQPIQIAGHSGPLAATAENWVSDQLAEPGLIECMEYLDRNPGLDISKDLLFAVAGMAEFAPTKDWLRWGGVVAVVARSNPQRWLRLIELARTGAGTLLVPIKRSLLDSDPDSMTDEQIAELAGLDLLQDYVEIASWMGSLQAREPRRFALGLYAYTPKVDHIRVQGVQEALADLAMENIPPNKLALSWLATPTDSAPGPATIANAKVSGFTSRTPGVIIRDSLLGLLDAARAPRPKYFSSDQGEKLALIDSSVQQQGPSYSFSKRTQRWRAYLAHYAGVLVSYAISPPARTESVLRHKILRASYRGAPLFGVKPFGVAEAKSAAALVLARDLNDESKIVPQETTTALHTQSAIHGGLWRLPYRPSSVWLAATILGLPALLRRGY